MRRGWTFVGFGGVILGFLYISSPASAAELKDLKAKGAQLLRLDVQFVPRHPEMRQRSVDFEKILRREEGAR